MRRQLIAASALVMLLAAPAYAQQADQHEQHHPAGQPAAAGMPSAPGGMMSMMGQMSGMMPQNCGNALGSLSALDKNLSADDVKAIIAGNLAATGNKRLKVGKVTEQDKDAVLAEIVTTDNSLVQKVLVDRHSGAVRAAE